MVKEIFVDRKEELKRLESFLTGVKEGKPTFVFISGEAGVGKATLIEHLIGSHEETLASFAAGATTESKSIPYHPFTQLVEQLSALGESNLGSTAAAQLSKLRGALDTKTSVVGDVMKEREILFESFSQFLEEVSRERVIVFFIDNLQWCDEGSILLLQHMALEMDKGKLLFLVTYRPEELEETDDFVSPVTGLLATLMMQDRLNTLVVERFDIERTKEMVCRLLEIEEAPEEFTKFIHDETEGSPMFIFELIEGMLEQGTIDPSEPNWAEELDYESVHTPGGIKEVISRRLEHIDEESLSILRTASIIGARFSIMDLAIITGRGRDELSGRMSELVQSKIVFEVLDSLEETYSFDHSKIKDVLYDSTDETTRRDLHQSIGEMLEVRNRPLEFSYSMAHHFCEAGDAQRGCRYAKLAGDMAYGAHAPKEAFDHYSRALGLVDSSDAAGSMRKDRIELLNGIGNMGHIIGDWPKAISSLEEAIKEARELGNETLLIESLSLLGNILRFKGDENKRTVDIFTEVLGISERSELEDSKAVAHRGLGYVHWREGLFDKAIQHYKKCIVSAKKTGDKRILGEINIEMGNATSGKGDLSGAAEQYKEAIRLLEATEHYSELSRAYNNLGDISLQRQEWDEAIQYFHKCGKAAEKIGYKNMLAWALFNMAEAQAKKGELVPALEKTEKAIIMLRKLGDQNGLSGAEKNLGIIYRFMKDWDRSREHFEIAVRLQEEMNNPQPLAETYIEYGAMNVDKGDHDRARSLMQKAIDITVQIQAKEFEKRARKLMKRSGGSH